MLINYEGLYRTVTNPCSLTAVVAPGTGIIKNISVLEEARIF